jgi:hypothetical protein
MEFDYVYWIDLAQDRVLWRDLVTTVMNWWVSLKSGQFLEQLSYEVKWDGKYIPNTYSSNKLIRNLVLLFHLHIRYIWAFEAQWLLLVPPALTFRNSCTFFPTQNTYVFRMTVTTTRNNFSINQRFL